MDDIDKSKLITYGPITSIWNVNGTKILKYQQEIWHNGLNEYKIITGQNKQILNNKVSVQVNKWIKNWKINCEKRILKI